MEIITTKNEIFLSINNTYSGISRFVSLQDHMDDPPLVWEVKYLQLGWLFVLWSTSPSPAALWREYYYYCYYY